MNTRQDLSPSQHQTYIQAPHVYELLSYFSKSDANLRQPSPRFSEAKRNLCLMAKT